MKQRRLGSSAIVTSAIGLGCMGFSQGYGHADETESIKAIHRAIDVGITMFDTAMTYGQGHNEQLLARALAKTPIEPSQLQIASKFGIARDEGGVHLDGRPEHVAGYCNASLKRLNIDVIDLYYLHRADPEVPIEETIGAMAELVAQGKVRYLGISEVTSDQLERAVSIHPIAAVQFEWSLLWRQPELDLIPTARSHGVGLVPYSPLGRGLLTATLDQTTVGSSAFRKDDPRFSDTNLERNLAQVRSLQSVATSLQITPGQLALAWLLAQGEDVIPIPGTRRAERISENALAADIELSAEDLRRLDKAVPPSAWCGDRRSFAVPVVQRGQRAMA